MVNLVKTFSSETTITASSDEGSMPINGRLTTADDLLHSRVSDALFAAGRPQLRTVSIAVTRGSVVLQGQVSSYYLKQVAQESVLAISEVSMVYNELRVN